ncbi:GDSL-type esterase/lipase family protein [Caulobacter sp. 1776]|uniref:GDSL-type esterase/lipase family protein n=1 Tax=Caulobacter sp. 1776 TaxID=3156420 RepID=UPI0033963DBF
MKTAIVAAALLMWAGAAQAKIDPVIPVWISSPTFRPATAKDGDVLAYDAQSVRQDIRIQAPTTRVALRLTNELGTSRVTVGKVELRVIHADGTLGEPRLAKFGGADGVTLEPGLARYTDFVDVSLPAFSDVAIIVHYPGRAEPAAHRAAVRVAQGDDTPGTDLKTVRGAAIVSAVETPAPKAFCRHVVVALGDSITEGSGSTPHNNWPSRIARHFHGKRCEVIVANAGISGNKVLSDGGSPGLLMRLDRDVFAIPGLTDIIFSEGINDIRAAETKTFDSEALAEQLLEGYRQLVVRAHAHGVRVIGGTLAPYKGTANQTEAGLAAVERVNSAIRSGAIFDAMVDFNRALADPTDPQRMRSEFQKGDWLHPNDAGYAAMAATVRDSLFASRPALGAGSPKRRLDGRRSAQASSGSR